MALKGTLKDFGIADILQLIGQQQKTGTLRLKSKDQEVIVSFKDGAIVKAESSFRNKKDLIGNMLVRAEIITEQQLQSALEVQKRSLKRLGDILVEAGALSAERFSQMVQLQTTETLYRLFSWKSGSYEFDQGEVEHDQDASSPLRAEAVLMEGFRMVDEWPVIKKKITSYQMAFERVGHLPPATASAKDDEDDLDAAFGGSPKEDSSDGIGEAERRVFSLIAPSRDVRKLVDLSCLGEFETCKALLNLVNGGFVRPVPGVGRVEEVAPPTGAGGLGRAGRLLGRLVASALLLGALGFLATQVRFEALSLGRSTATTFTDPAAQRFISRHQIARIEAALEVYLAETGEVPTSLAALVDAGLLGREDLRYPWRDDYYYRRTGPGRFVLLPPLR